VRKHTGNARETHKNEGSWDVMRVRGTHRKRERNTQETHELGMQGNEGSWDVMRVRGTQGS
jgi:hypothetical protein